MGSRGEGKERNELKISIGPFESALPSAPGLVMFTAAQLSARLSISRPWRRDSGRLLSDDDLLHSSPSIVNLNFTSYPTSSIRREVSLNQHGHASC